MVNNGSERQKFMSEIIDILSGICKRKGFNIDITPSTLIFDHKILDSVGFVEFISTIETDLSVEISDYQMSTEYFLTPECITLNFGP